MVGDPNDPKQMGETYSEFVERRARTTNFRAAEKLQRIDELADMIFTARENYRKMSSRSGLDSEVEDT